MFLAGAESNKSQLPQTNYGPLTIELIKKQQADVICFQEFWDRNDWYSKELNLKAFKVMGYPYHYFVKSFNEGEIQKTGVAILSKIPYYRFSKNSLMERMILLNTLFMQIYSLISKNKGFYNPSSIGTL